MCTAAVTGRTRPLNRPDAGPPGGRGQCGHRARSPDAPPWPADLTFADGTYIFILRPLGVRDAMPVWRPARGVTILDSHRSGFAMPGNRVMPSEGPILTIEPDLMK